MNRKITILSAVVAASVVSGSLAYATTVASSKVTACADKKSGVLRVATSCKSSEKSVPLISGSVQLAPAYFDANKKPLNVLGAAFDQLGQPIVLNALVGGKYVTVDGLTGKVYPLGSTTYTWYAMGALYYLQSDCSGTPFIWFSNSLDGDSDARNLYQHLKTNKNYAGYFVATSNDADKYYKISDTLTAFAGGTPVYHRSPFDGTCSRNSSVNNGEGYVVTGYTTIALQAYTGTRIANYKGPISVTAQ